MPVIMKDNVQYAYTTKGTVFHTLSNAEYEALTEEEKMNGDVYCIPDREPVINPDEVWAKIGTETLDIGDDLTDGVNRLNSSLTIDLTYSNGSNNSSNAYRLGRLVIVNIDFTPNVASGAGGAYIISGLPSPKALEWATLINRNNDKHCTCQLAVGETSIKIFHTIASERYIGQLVYIAN